ncbi:MAG TPA: 4'-phosphopantetheinyl transferase superfamily protein [Candidatus Binatia bacterium]
MPTAILWLLDGNRVGDDALAFFVQRLSSSEANRYDSFLRRERQRQFLLGRTLLRFAVSNLTGLPVDKLDVVERPGNAPLLVLPGSQHASPNFSLSHSRNWVACVVSCDVTLGLDIEVNETARDTDAISELMFHPSEYLWLLTLSNAERVSSFYEIWCAREALHKLLCNLGREADLSPSVESNVAQQLERFGWHQTIRAFPGLSIVAVSDRRFAIRERIVERVTRADWIAASQHPYSN